MPSPNPNNATNLSNATPAPQGAAQLFVAIMLVILPALLAYWPVGEFDFIVYDDGLYITRNSVVQNGLTWSGLTWAFTSLEGGNWHPITWLSHMLDMSLYGLNPGGHHLNNLLLHLLASLLLLAWIYQLTGALWRSTLLAVLFALHPTHIQSVAWIAERKDTLSAIFLFLTLIAYSHYRQSPSLSRYALIVVAFTLGLMCKSSLVTLPILLILIDFWPLQRYHKQPVIWQLLQSFRDKLPLFAISLAFGILTIFAQDNTGAMVGSEVLSLTEKIGHAIVAYGWYLLKTFLPWNLAITYPYPVYDALAIATPVFILTGLSFAAYRYRHSAPWLLVGWLWFLITLLPMVGIIKVGNQPYADRYLYLAQTGLMLATIWSIAQLTPQRWRTRIGLLSFGILVPALTVITANNVQHWRNSETLLSHATSRIAGNFQAHELLGHFFFDQRDFDRAIQQYQQAAAFKPDDAAIWNALGVAHIRQGQQLAAVNAFSRALAQNKDLADARYNLAKALDDAGQNTAATPHWAILQQNPPERLNVLMGLGDRAYRSKDYHAAANLFKRATALAPEQAATYFNLALAEEKREHFAAAKQAYQRAAQYDPSLRARIEKRLSRLPSVNE